MFDYMHYVPILKGKAGEFQALEQITGSLKDNFTPLFEIIKPGKATLDNYLVSLIKTFSRAWIISKPFFLDLKLIEELGDMNSGIQPVIFLCSEFYKAGFVPIPVVRLSDKKEYLSSVKRISEKYSNRVCLRIEDNDLLDKIEEKIDTILRILKLKPENIDLVIDLKAIDNEKINSTLVLIRSVINSFPYINLWHTLILSATSFPKDLSGLKNNYFTILKRGEWIIWSNIRNNPTLFKRIPTFSDYGISHSEMVEVSPVFMDRSASIRYTAETYWLIAKGRSVKLHGAEQSHRLCKALIKRSEYCGSSFSWGDCYIDECANEKDGPGNATTWRKVGTNHHICFVVDQIAKIP